MFAASYQDLDSLHRRLGEIRESGDWDAAPKGEAFVRTFGARLKHKSDRGFNDYGFNSTQRSGAVQIGYNRTVENASDGTLRLGLAGTLHSMTFTPQAVDGESRGTFNAKTLAGLVTWQSQAGWYVDGVVSGGVFDGRVETDARAPMPIKGASFAASLEAGYPVSLGTRNVVLEPQVQIMYQHLAFERGTDSDAIDLNLGNLNQGVARVGARLTRAFVSEGGTSVTPYIKANLLQGIGGGDAIQLGGAAFSTSKFGRAVQIGGGITGKPTPRLSLYSELAWQHEIGNGGGARGWTANLGLRYAFGG